MKLLRIGFNIIDDVKFCGDHRYSNNVFQLITRISVIKGYFTTRRSLQDPSEKNYQTANR